MSVEPMAAHPISRAIEQVEEALDLAREADPAYLSQQAHREALLELTRLGDRLESLRMRVIRAADGPGGVAEADGASSPASWLAARSRTGFGPARRAERLGEAVAERWQRVGAALEDGRMRVEQARVIVKALDALPVDEIDADVLARAEARLVQLADRYDPRKLEVLGEKILEVVAPETYDDQERKALEAAQRRANSATRLTFHRRGDGATDVKARIPDAVAARLRTMLESWTSPRQESTGVGAFAQRDPATGVRLPQERLHGEAFRAFLEAADPSRMPIHGGSATRIVVTIDLDGLLSGLGAGTIVSSGDAMPRLTNSEVRRLACQAGIIPAVLGSKGQVLDLGRTSRFFSELQRLARMITHPVCAAQGCTVPSQWCEGHHAGDPWALGGRTDLADLEFLCPWHHQRAHDPAFSVERLPNGDVRFARRT